MKVYELIDPQEQLDEISLKHAAAAGIMGASLMGMPHKANTPNAPHVSPTAQIAPVEPKRQLDPKLQTAIETIASRYGADSDLVEQVFELAKKYEKPGFPTARDILAIIAVESDFNPDAVSQLKTDPAVGLMQVRPQKWKMSPEELKDPETSIRVGSAILHKYYKHLRGNKEAAVQAYNIGMKNFRQGQESPNYLNKFVVRLSHMPTIEF